MKTGMIVLIALGLAVVLGGCQFVSTRNKLATEKEGIAAEFAQVDADLQRRADGRHEIVEHQHQRALAQLVEDREGRQHGQADRQQRDDRDQRRIAQGAGRGEAAILDEPPDDMAHEPDQPMPDPLVRRWAHMLSFDQILVDHALRLLRRPGKSLDDSRASTCPFQASAGSHFRRHGVSCSIAPSFDR